ncbi:MAG: serine hydrolase [Bacteroidales bacterium]|nr:serine hydrolase [Bacteroidales bacterium]MDD3891716.1 serine hydrolase [Bacteroidales bacterium]
MKRFYLIALLVLSFSTLFAINPIDTARVNPFMDGVLKAKLRSSDVAGGVIVLTSGSEVILKRGYGYADILTREPVAVDSTLFRIGSISKLFVWLAVMQQVEEGKLDLNTNINTYLTDFKIPDSFDEAVTLTHLMGHTAGFEDRVIGLFVNDTDKLKSLSELLADDLPKRIRRPGEYASYSNHGAAVAAHIVEIVSGLSWNEYVEQKIINPLGLYSTTFRQPLPDSLASRMSKGYANVGGQLMQKPFELIPLAAIGAATTSARDMAIFIQMLLNKGSLGDVEIIDSTSFNLMLSPSHRHDKWVNPSLHGFLDLGKDGCRIIGHGGDTFWFHSLLALLPDQNIGLFISQNSEGRGNEQSFILDAFVDEFMDCPNEPMPVIEFKSDYLEQFAGEYISNRYPHSDYLKLISLGARLKILVDGAQLKMVKGNKITYWNPVGSVVFQQEWSNERIAFEKDKKGKISMLFEQNLPIVAYSKAKPYEKRGAHIMIFTFILITCLLALLYWPFVYIIRRRYQPISIVSRAIPVGSKLVAWSSALLLAVFALGVLSVLGGKEQAVYAVPSLLKILLIIPIIQIPLVVLMFVQTIGVFGHKTIGLTSRMFYLLILLANIAALWELYYWNFLGWNY